MMNDDDVRPGPETASMLISAELRKSAESAREALRLLAELREEMGEDRWREILADPDPQYDGYRTLARETATAERSLAAFERMEAGRRDEAEGN